MFFNKKKENETKLEKTVFPATLPEACDGEYREYSCPDSTLELSKGRYKLRVDETGEEMGEYASLTEEYGTFTIENRCEIFVNPEQEIVDGKETPATDFISFQKKSSLGFFVDNRVIAPVTEVSRKNDILTITVGKKPYIEKYVLANGKCERNTSMKIGFSAHNTSLCGSYVSCDNQLQISFEKFDVMFIEYGGQYYNVLYVKE